MIGRHLLSVWLVVPALVGCGGADVAVPVGSSSEAIVSSNARADRALIRTIEDHRLLGDARLKAFLKSAHPSVAEAAAIAAGRIGDPALQPDVIALLDAGPARVRAAAALGLQLLGGGGAEAALAARLGKEGDAGVRQALLLALGHVGSAASLPLVTAPLLAKEPAEIQTAAAEALATLVRAGAAITSLDPAVPARLLALSAELPEPRATASAFALAALAPKLSLSESVVVSAFQRSPAPSARAYLTRALASLQTPTANQVLATALSKDANPRVRADSCRFLARAGATPEVLAALSAALDDGASQVAVAAATALATLGPAAASTSAALGASFNHSRSAWVRSTVLTTLVAVAPAGARSRVEAGLADSWPVQLAAIPALAVLAGDADVARLVALAGGADTRLAFAAIEAIATLDPSHVTDALKSTLRARLASRDFEIISGVADTALAFGWKDFAPDLAALYDAFPGPGDLNGRLAIVNALGTLGAPTDVPLLERGLGDDEHLVSQTAADAYQTLTGTDVSARVRAQSVVHDRTPSEREVQSALSSLVLLATTRGLIVMRMLPEAPLSATNFVSLVKSGFYDGLPFHRVVPNFVAQGGDPRGDGYGGSDRLVREEISTVPHRRGTVGMATEGKDTGSSQIFINSGWNVSLDGNYTVFAEVVQGMPAADLLEVGDTIYWAVAIPTR